MRSEKFYTISELARKILAGKGFKRSIVEVFVENKGRILKKEAMRILMGEDVDKKGKLDSEFKLLSEASRKEADKREVVIGLLNSYLEVKKMHDEFLTLMSSVGLKVKVMVLALSFTLGCMSIMVKLFTNLFQSVEVNVFDLIPYALSALIATYYSMELTGKKVLKWVLLSTLTFISSYLVMESLFSELIIVGS